MSANESMLHPLFLKGYYSHQESVELDSGYFFDITRPDIARKFPHILEDGNTRTGKGVNLQKQIENAYDRGYKIISINRGREIEHAYKRYPAEGSYARKLMSRGANPRGYPVEVYHPVCYGYLPKELPDFFHLYTIPLASQFRGSRDDDVTKIVVDADLLSTVNMVGITEIGKDAINDIMEEFGEDDNVADLYYEVGKRMDAGLNLMGMWFKTVGPKSEESMHRGFYRLAKFRMMSQASHPRALTSERFLNDICNKQKEISVFSQTFVPSYLQPFCTLFILQLVDAVAEKCKHPIMLVATEIETIMQSIDYINMDPAIMLLSKQMANFAQRGGKRRIRFVGDTQILSKINSAFIAQALLLSFYTDIASKSDYEAYARKVKYKGILKDLQDILHSLRFDPQKGIFQYYIPAFNRKYFVDLPRSATPWEGNKSDFLAYVRKMGKRGVEKCGWYQTDSVYGEIESAIIETVKKPEIQEYIASKKDMAADVLKKIMQGRSRGKIERRDDGYVPLVLGA